MSDDRVMGGAEALDTTPDFDPLLERHESVRDPIHGDIWITALERALIDTQAFQRLRHIQQLGPTSIVYPGATHTRFLHSLGTVHVVDRLIEIANRNAHAYGPERFLIVEGYARVLARLVALLHDTAHIPFGHTLEDEGNLYQPEWEDTARVEHWLGDDSEIGRAFIEHLDARGYTAELAGRLLGDIRTHLTTRTEDVDTLDYPYVADLVGNTLCADLLDYTERDSYFCGLRERIGDRFINYVAVLELVPSPTGADREEYRVAPAEVAGKGRVVLLGYRIDRSHRGTGETKSHRKWDVLSEAMDLLRRRFTLAEKVYFHRTKLAASSMLISAVGESSIAPADFYQATDDDIMRLLETDANPRTARLADAYRRRRLYRPLYQLSYRKESEWDQDARHLWRVVYGRFRDKDNRLRLERDLEDKMGMEPGSISIYCPDREMNLKGFEMLVQIDPESEVKKFSELLDDPRQQEMRALNVRFEQLWGLQLFVDPTELDPVRVGDPRVRELNGLCESPELFGLANEVGKLRGTGMTLRESLAAQVADEWDEIHPDELVTYQTYKVLASSPLREGETVTRDRLRAMLKELMAAGTELPAG